MQEYNSGQSPWDAHPPAPFPTPQVFVSLLPEPCYRGPRLEEVTYLVSAASLLGPD